MKSYVLGTAVAVLFIGCSDNSNPPPTAKKSASTTNNSSGNPVTAPVDYLGAVAKAKKTSIRVADVASVSQAIQLFKQEEERYPKDLNELVTKQYLPALPAPPYQMKYQYDATSGKVSVVPIQ
jgi:hypothetical protein